MGLKDGWTWASREGLYTTPSWRKLRNSVIKDEPLCRMCRSMKEYTPATMVDHIEAITPENWEELFLDRDNLQPLCFKCHSFKTRRDKIPKKDVDMDFLLSL